MCRYFILLLLIVAASCGERSSGPVVRAVPIDKLPGYQHTNLLAALPVFLATCPNLLSASGDDWRSVCDQAQSIKSEAQARQWLLDGFAAVTIDGGEGLATGYYEPVFEASSSQTLIQTAPVLTQPDDLISVDLGRFREELAGQRVAGRVQANQLVPYADHQMINERGVKVAEPIAWMHPDDLFFLQIQGSGVLMVDGEARKVGYAAQNGHPYHAIGRTLVEEGHLALDDVTMQSIRRWLNEASPEEAARVRETNPSYVFFADRGTADSDAGPLGSARVPLTPGVSVAVDPQIYPLGTPLWITGGMEDGVLFAGLYIAQDTGGAIKGAGRVDLFVGRGEGAGEVAGALKEDVSIIAIVPKSVATRLLERAS